MKLLKRIGLVFGVAAVLASGLQCGWWIGGAFAHSGSPAMVTWANGQTLTAADLNQAFAHIHNTLSGGITDVNLSTSAAIAHSKLATPALVPKAWGLIREAMACDAVPGTDCTLTKGVKVTRVWGSGTAGKYNVDLAYVPPNTDKYVVLVTQQDQDDVVCAANSFGTLAAPIDFQIVCRTVSGAPAAINSRFSFVVIDSP